MSSHTPLMKMTREQLITQLERELVGAKRMRYARRLAPEFIRYYGIFPHGVDLIPWFTQSYCRTNAEALVDWIEAQMEDPTLLEDGEAMPESILIADRLEQRLALIEESYAW